MNAVLFAHMVPPSGPTEDFFDWHVRHNVPGRLAVPGFKAGHVYRKLGDPPAQAVVYELEHLDALDSPEYGRLREATDDATRPRLAALSDSVRAAGTLIAEGGKADIAAPVLLALWFDVPTQRLEDFDDWYVNEHGPLILQVERWRRWRLFDISTSNAAVTRLVLHDLDSPGSSERLRADRRWQTPRFRELQKYEWFRDVASHEYVRIT